MGSVLFEGIDELKSAIVLACAPLIALVVFFFLRKVDTTIAKISAFIYLRNAICPSSRVMFYWYHAADCKCSRSLCRLLSRKLKAAAAQTTSAQDILLKTTAARAPSLRSLSRLGRSSATWGGRV